MQTESLPFTALSTQHAALVVRKLGLSDYERTWRAMQNFTAARTAGPGDELGLVEPPPVRFAPAAAIQRKRQVGSPWR